jgi:uncharacterized protein GlcG (DUF336 family)
MTTLTLPQAQTIIDGAIRHAREAKLQPLAVAVLDTRGVLKAFGAEDGTSLRRYEVASGKAHGALSLGIGSRAIFRRATEQPAFVAAVTHAVGGSLIPVPGGVLIRDGGTLLGAVGISGDTSDNDEAAAIAGIQAAGFTPDAG